MFLVSRVNGSTQIYFKVNESPNLGACSIRPSGTGSVPEGGIEMSTDFSVYCEEWTDNVCIKLFQMFYWKNIYITNKWSIYTRLYVHRESD